MKKTILIALTAAALFLTAGTGFGQISYGVIGGPGVSGFAGDDRDSFDARLGLSFGGFLETPLLDNLLLHSELLFSLRGAGLAGSADKITLWFLDVPVLLRYQLPLNTEVPINFFAGPYLGINLSAKVVNGTTTSVDNVIKNFDIGLHLGAGIELGDFLIDARYRAGMTDIHESDAVDLTNSGFLILVGYRIR